MKSSIFTRFITIILLLLGVGNRTWAATVTYTISSKNTLSTTGTAPSGSSASIVETYGTSKQMTSGNSQTLTLKGYNGYKITQIVLSMKSNKSSGAGKLSYSTDAGATYTYIVDNSGSGVAFNNASWYGAWSQNYVNITKSVDITATSSDLKIKIEATANSLYCQSYEITYEAVGGGSTPTVSLNKSSTSIVAGSQETLTATTTNPTGAAVTWTTNNSGVATVSGGTVTAVAPGTATITAALSSNPSIKATCAVTVTAISRTISITTTDMDLTVGGTSQTRTGTLSAGTGTITYSSSNDDVATVNSSTGEVTPVGEGSCTITVSVPAVGNYAAALASYTVNVTDPNKGRINFNSSGGPGCMAILAQQVTSTGTDTGGNTWSVTPIWQSAGQTSCTNNADKVQVGSGAKPITSISFTMTLPYSRVVKSMQCKFSAFSDDTGTISMSVDGTTVGTGSLSGTSLIIVNSNRSATGTTLSVTITASRVVCYYISYELEDGDAPILSDGDYVKVTSEPADWSGTYLIVYEDGELAMNGGLTTLDISGNSIDVDIVGNKIAANVANDAASFNIFSDGDDGWAILSRNGLYIGQTANGNGLRTSPSIISNGLSLSGTDAEISCGYTTLRYNYANNQERFRYYTSGQQPVALYKRQVALKSATVISFGDTEKILAIGQHWTNALETNNTTGAKTYSSSNSSIVSVDSETGEVTAVAAGGPVTITVNVAETASHTAGTASYTVTVVASSVRYYRPVTSTIEIDAGIAAGKRFVIAVPKDGAYYAMGAINSSHWAASVEVPTEEREVTYLKVDADLTSSVNEFALVKSSDYYSFRQSLENSYLSHETTNLEVHDINASSTNSSDFEKFSLAYVNGAWAIVNKGTPNWYLQYNQANPRFCCYVNSQTNPMIFMEGIAVAAIGDDFAPEGVWTGEDGTFTVSVTPVTGLSDEDYTIAWFTSNEKVSVIDEAMGDFESNEAGDLDVTILVSPVGASIYSPVARTFPMLVTGTVTDRGLSLFHESFGDNSGSARAWNEAYSEKTGVETVYSGITSYTITNAKQSKNTVGFELSGLSQSEVGTNASIVIGPLNVANYTNLKVTYQWKAGSVKGTYSTSLSYATSSSGAYTNVTGTGSGEVGFKERTYNLPAAAQVSSLYLKIVFNTSNTQAVIDEVELSGIATTYSFKLYEGTSKYKMIFVQKVNPSLTLTDNAIAVVDGLTSAQKTAMPDAIKGATNVVINGTTSLLSLSDYTMSEETKVYHPFYAPDVLTTSAKVSYTRPNAGGWNSVCLPFSIPYGKVTELFGSGAKVYQLTGVNAEHNVVFTELTDAMDPVPAGEPVLVYSEDDTWNATNVAGSFSIKGDVAGHKVVGNATTTGTAEIIGTYSTMIPGTVDGSTLYKLKADGTSFGTMSATAKVYPFRMYIKYTPPTASSAPANLPVKIHVIEGTIGDLNKDKMATLSDLTRMINMVNGAEEKTNAADLDGDGEVNGVDVNRLAKILTKSK